MGVYPQTALPVVVEIAPGAAAVGDPSGAAFVDVTTSAFQVADKIDIGLGRGDWGQDADAGTCSLTFNNDSGDFSEHNPMGQWYGLLGKDTPLRVALRRGEDTFSRTSASTWTTSDSGHTWAGFGVGGSVLATDQTVSGGLGRQSVPQANAFRASWMSNLSLLDVRVRLSGITLPFGGASGGSVEPGNILLRVQDTATFYLARIEITTSSTVICRLYNPAGTELANKTVAGLTFTGAPLEAIAEITGDQIRMKVWASAGTEPGAWTVTATDTNPLLKPGGIGIRTGVAAGNLNTKPIVATYDRVQVFADLHGGWVPAWVPRLDISGKFRMVPVSSKGALYRMKDATGKSPAVSPFRRLVTSSPKLLAYWPCEDGAGSAQVGSAIPGGTPMAVTGSATFAGDPSDAGGSGFERNFIALGFTNLIAPGTKALPNLAAGASFFGRVPRVGTSSPIEWAVTFVARSNSLQAGKEILLAEWDCAAGGTYKTFRLYQQLGGTIELFGIRASDDVGLSLGNWADFSVVLTEYRVEAVQVGANATIRIWVDGDLKSNVTFSSTTLTRVTTVTANPLRTSVTGVTGWWIGHIQVWDTSIPPLLGHTALSALDFDGYGAPVFPFYRHLNETGHDRLKRFGVQDNMPMFIPPVDAAQVTRMGPQPDGIPLDLYRECERTDGGVIYERPFALGYQPRSVLYAQPAALALAASDLADAPAPDGTSQRYRNRWLVNRTLGSSAVAEAPEVAQGAIVNDEAEDINTATESVLRDQAAWRLHLVSGKELRWPTLEIDLWMAPQLMDAWLNCRPGSRITVANPPADVAGQDIDVILEGWTVTLGQKSFRIVANCSPAKPWRVAAVAAGARVGSATAKLNTGASSGAPTISVADPAGAWDTAGPFGWDINVGGERMTVTNITGATSPQTFTVQRSKNGVVKAQTVNTPVRLWAPYVVGM